MWLRYKAFCIILFKIRNISKNVWEKICCLSLKLYFLLMYVNAVISIFFTQFVKKLFDYSFDVAKYSCVQNGL